MIDIRVEGLVKSFDLEKKILDGLTFQVDTGERVVLFEFHLEPFKYRYSVKA